MLKFITRYRNVSALAVILLLQLVLIGYQVKQKNGMRSLRVWSLAIFSPIQKSLHAVTSELSGTWRGYIWLLETQKDNERLKKQISKLKLENQHHQRTLASVIRKKELANYQDRIPSKTTLAQVIGHSAAPDSREVFISKGREVGIEPGMAVITPEGIAGRIQAAYHGTSIVRLVHDVDSGVGVLLKNSRSRGVMRGTGSPGKCRVDYIRAQIQVLTGEEVYTSGEDRIFPRGLPVGKISWTEQGQEFQEIYLSPFAQLDRLDDVLVILSGLHQLIPEKDRVQLPELLMHPPNKKIELTEEWISDYDSESTNSNGMLPTPVTEADLVLERHRSVNTAQNQVLQEKEEVAGYTIPNLDLDRDSSSPLNPRASTSGANEITGAGATSFE